MFKTKKTITLLMTLVSFVVSGAVYGQVGLMWEPVGEAPVRQLSIMCLAYAPQHPIFPGGVLLAGTRAHGIWLSTDGDHWEPAGLDGVNVSTLALAGDGTIYAGEGDLGTIGLGSFTGQGIYRSTDGRQWSVKKSGLEQAGGFTTVRRVSALAVNSGGKVFVSVDGRLFSSQDRGDSWQRLDNALIEFVDAITIGSDDRLILGSHGLEGGRLSVLSADGASILNMFALPPHDEPQALARKPGSADIFAGMRNKLSSPLNFYHSADSSPSWDESASIGEKTVWTEGDAYPVVRQLAIRASGDLFAVLSTSADPVYRSANLGKTWASASTGLEGQTVNSILAADNGKLFVGTEGHGIYCSTWLVPVELSRFYFN